MGASKNLKQAYTRQNDITNKSVGIGDNLYGQAQQAFGQRQDYLRQPTSFWQDMASGDHTKMLTAAAPAISNISKQAQSAIGGIQDTVAPGAARNFAVAQIQRDKFSKGADFLNQAYMSSFPALQGLASDTGNFGLQQLGGGMRGFESAQEGNQQIIQSESARQAAKMNMIGSVASLAGGGVMGAIKGMGGGATKAAAPNYSDGIKMPNNFG